VPATEDALDLLFLRRKKRIAPTRASRASPTPRPTPRPIGRVELSEAEEEEAVEEEEDAEFEEEAVERVSIAELEAPVGIEVLESESDTTDPVVQAYSTGGSASTKFELSKEHESVSILRKARLKV